MLVELLRPTQELDNEAELMPLPFPFPHYLEYHDSAFVSCNGALILDPVLDEIWNVLRICFLPCLFPPQRGPFEGVPGPRGREFPRCVCVLKASAEEITRQAAVLGSGIGPHDVVAAMWADMTCPKEVNVSAFHSRSADSLGVKTVAIR